MADNFTARPVSGELMTNSQEPACAVRDDCIDVEFETIQPRRQAIDPPSATSGDFSANGLEGLRLANAMPRARPFSTRGGPLFWLAGAALVPLVFWTAGGHSLMHRDALGEARSTDVHSFRIDKTVSEHRGSNGKRLLMIDGEVVNVGYASSQLPGIEISVTGTDGRITRYKVGTSHSAMEPGERFAFSSRLEAPKEGTRTVSVNFSESL